jgi:probable phosphoglycerate mutase
MPVVLLIRHGENDVMHRALAGRMPGVHLNKVGQSQAVQLAENLKSLPVRAIYSSPLERAMETAAPLAARLNLPIQVQDGLLEIDYGRWQGRTYKQLQQTKLWKILHQEPSRVRFPDGETLEEAQHRLVMILEKIAGWHSDQDLVACFTHADGIRLAVAHFLNLHLDDFHRLTIHPTGVSAILLGAGLPRLLYLNQTWSAQPWKES